MAKLKKLIIWVICTTMILVVLPVIVSANTIETYFCDAPNVVVRRELNDGGVGPVANFYIDSTEKYSGKYSAKLTWESAPSNLQFRMHMGAPATVGKTYRVGFMAKAKNASDIKVTINSVGNWISLTKNYGTTFDWKRIEYEFVFTRENFKEMDFIISSWDKCDGFWVDDLYVYEYKNGVRVSDNLFKNPGFEDIGSMIPIGEKAIESEENEKIDMVKPLESADAVLVDTSKIINIDGKDEDWSEHKSHAVSNYIAIDPFTIDEQSLRADIKYSYDDKYLYFLLKTVDEKHVFIYDKYWNGDNIQFAIDNNNKNGYGEPFAMSYNDIENCTVVYNGTSLSEMDISDSDDIKAAASKYEDGVIYEFAVSWDYLGIQKPDSIKFNLMINDNDGLGRKGWLEIAPGISSNRTNLLYPALYLNRNNYITKLTTESENVPINEDVFCTVKILNITDESLNLRISGDMEKEVEIPSGSYYINKYQKVFKQYGKDVTEINTTNSVTGELDSSLCEVNVIPSENTYLNVFETASKWRDELSELIKKCEDMQLKMPYEKAEYTIIDSFVSYMQDDYERYKAFDRIGHYYLCINEMYNELKPILNSYIEGKAEPMNVPDYVSDIYYDYNKKHFYGTVEKNGIQSVQPVLLNSLQSHEAVDNLFELSEIYGMNTIEIGHYFTDFSRYSNGKFVRRDINEVPVWRTEPPLQELRKKLEKCEKMGYTVYYVLSMSFDTSVAEGMYENGKDYYSFMNFNPTHPLIFDQIDLAIEAVMSVLNEFNCVESIMIHNEPSFYAYDKTYYKDSWVEFLENRYHNDINELNKAYKSDYSKFKDVPMSQTATNDTIFNDYRNFNDSILEKYFEHAVTEIRKYNKDIPVWTKQMMPVRAYGGAKTAGVNFENISKYLDLCGNDAFAYITNAPFTLASKMEWYDIQNSIKDAPVMQGENHVIEDGSGNVNYDPRYPNHYSADVWEGMIHGTGLQTQWLFSRTDRTFNSYPQTTLLARPDTLSKVVKASFDIQRLTPEIIALQDVQRNIAILYSDTSYSFNGQFMNCLYSAYTNCIFNGQRPFFVVESQLDKLTEKNFLIVPACTNVKEETFNAIKEFVDRGGKLIIIGEGSLCFDDRDVAFDKDVVDYIYSKSILVNAKIEKNNALINIDDKLGNILADEFKKSGYGTIELYDARTNNRCNDVEYIYTDYDGKKIINICNYSWDGAKDIDIYINGVKQTNVNELRFNKTYNDSITVNSFEPLLVEITN